MGENTKTNEVDLKKISRGFFVSVEIYKHKDSPILIVFKPKSISVSYSGKLVSDYCPEKIPWMASRF